MFPPDQLVSFINYCPYSPASLTDHAYIELDISEGHNSFQRQTEYWKLNTYFLEHSSYWTGIKIVIEKIKMNSDSAITKWVLFKYGCWKWSVQFGKQLSKAKESRSSVISKCYFMSVFSQWPAGPHYLTGQHGLQPRALNPSPPPPKKNYLAF